MTAPIVQVQYDTLEDVIKRFDDQADDTSVMIRGLLSAVEQLRGGAWVGEAATSFYREMDEELFPTLERLEEAFVSAGKFTGFVIETAQTAEEEAANQFQIENQGGQSGEGGSRFVPDFIEDGFERVVAGGRDLWGDATQFAGGVYDKIPFNNVVSASVRELLGQESISLDADALELVQSDPELIAYQDGLVSDLQSDPRYGHESFTVEISHGVGFGGERAPGAMLDQLKGFWKPEYRDTWRVAGDELTWLLRHAQVDSVATVLPDGSITISHELTDTLDLRPGEGRSPEYNAVTNVLGTIWHDVLGAEESNITGTWDVQIPAE